MTLIHVARTLSLLGLVLVMGGCSTAPSKETQAVIDKQKLQIAQLESENQELKARLERQNATTEVIKSMTKTAGQTASNGPAATVADSGTANNSSEGTSKGIAIVKFSDLANLGQRPMIEDLAKIGVFDTSSDQFRPDEKISRGEYAKLLFLTYNKLMPEDKQIHLAPSAAPFFKDLNADNQYYQYVQALANAGFSVGYEDNTFHAERPITREELIGMKIGVDCGKAFEPYRGQMAFVWKFSDSKDVNEKFTGYIHQDFYVSGQYGSNIQRAFGKLGAFHPRNPVTRAEAAGTLWQMGQWGNHGYTASNVLKQMRANI